MVEKKNRDRNESEVILYNIFLFFSMYRFCKASFYENILSYIIRAKKGGGDREERKNTLVTAQKV
jgi:hypothetical protein